MNTYTPQTATPNAHGVTPQAHSGRVPEPQPQPDRLIRIKTVCELTGMGKTSIYSLPDFPSRVVLTPQAVAWRLSEVVRWIESRTVAAQPTYNAFKKMTDSAPEYLAVTPR